MLNSNKLVLQILMNAWTLMVAVIITAPTSMEAMNVPADMASHWTWLMEPAMVSGI